MKQDSRWSDVQLTTLKGALSDNETAITAIRKVFLEDELTENEKAALKLAVQDNEAMQHVLRRHYCPQLVVDAPIGQVQDRLCVIATEDLSPDMVTLQAAATEKAEACMEAHLEEMFTGKPGMSFKTLYKLDLDDPVSTHIGLMARNKYIIDAEKLTHHLQLLAGKKDESPEETMARLRKDSAK